jgi:hypothetical protein
MEGFVYISSYRPVSVGRVQLETDFLAYVRIVIKTFCRDDTVGSGADDVTHS